jgi:hypothetical protein
MGFLKPKQVGPSQGDVAEASKPYGLTGPTGGITWDYDAKTGTATLSPEMAALADRLFGRAETQAAALSAYDPQTAAQEYYQQYVAPDLMRGQEEQRLALENRLLSQGMLGSTGGMLQSRGLLEAQEQSRRMGMAESFNQSQALLDAMRQREMADIAAAAGIYEAPISLFQTGAGVGANLGGIMASYKPTYQQSTGMSLLQMGAGVAAGMATGGAWGAGGAFAPKVPPSDKRLKTNIKEAGKTPTGIKLYTWDWNDKAKELGLDWGPTFGVMAQEIKDIIPEAVITGNDGYYRVDYSKVH